MSTAPTETTGTLTGMVLPEFITSRIDPERLDQLTPEEWAHLSHLFALVAQDAKDRPWAQYPTDPVGYARDILGVELTDVQKEIAIALTQPPYKVKCDSGHNVGKTFLAAVLANWWFDQFDPGIVVTTAPTERDVKDLLWTEIRLLRARAKVKFPQLPMCFIGPRAPDMFHHDDHYAKGYTANQGESFQGRHRKRMFFIFDEDEALAPIYYTTTKTMFKPEEGHAWFSIGNPTTTTSQAYLETQLVDQNGLPVWKLFRMSAMDHPNILAQLRGDEPTIPSAVTIGQLEGWIFDEGWCTPIADGDQILTDFQWPPPEFGTPAKPSRWYRPGPLGCARILGRRPDQGTYGVWSPALWEACERLDKKLKVTEIAGTPEIGCDTAHFGDDFTAWHVRWGPLSLHHESVNGWDTIQIAQRCKELATDFAAQANRIRPAQARPLTAHEIPIKLDDAPVGYGVSDILIRDGYNVIGITAGSDANRDEYYPNRRSELWFDTVDRARTGGLDLHLLPQMTRLKLKMQALGPVWAPDGRGRRVVEKKLLTKERIGRSPDDMDAVNLAYAPSERGSAEWVDPPSRPRGQTMGAQMGMLGRERPDDEGYGETKIRTLGR